MEMMGRILSNVILETTVLKERRLKLLVQSAHTILFLPRETVLRVLKGNGVMSQDWLPLMCVPWGTTALLELRILITEFSVQLVHMQMI